MDLYKVVVKIVFEEFVVFVVLGEEDVVVFFFVFLDILYFVFVEYFGVLVLGVG